MTVTEVDLVRLGDTRAAILRYLPDHSARNWRPRSSLMVGTPSPTPLTTALSGSEKTESEDGGQQSASRRDASFATFAAVVLNAMRLARGKCDGDPVVDVLSRERKYVAWTLAGVSPLARPCVTFSQVESLF